MKPDPQTDSQHIETPAKTQADHVQYYLDKAGGRMGWKRELPHDVAYSRGKLLCKDRIVDRAVNPKLHEETLAIEVQHAINRRDCWHEFTEKWLLCQAAFPGGSDYNRVRAVGIPGSFCDLEIDTKRTMERVRTNLGTRDWMLCRRVCGEGWSIAEAVTDISPSYRDSTLARFRESLDACIEAFETARRG